MLTQYYLQRPTKADLQRFSRCHEGFHTRLNESSNKAVGRTSGTKDSMGISDNSSSKPHSRAKMVTYRCE